jgi:hypothetical protein
VDGHTVLEHLEFAAERSESAKKELEELPDFPQEMQLLWDYFQELSLGRGVGMIGMEPLTYQDIDSWARLMDHQLPPHFVSALLFMDISWRNGLRSDEENG